MKGPGLLSLTHTLPAITMGFWGGTFLFLLLEAGMAAAVVFRSKPHTVG